MDAEHTLFAPPSLDADDLRVIGEIDDFRKRLRHFLNEPRRWKGHLRRNLKARAIRGSNSIEGYDVTLDDAVAIIEDEEPLDADRRTSLEIVGYRNTLTYIQQLANDEFATLDQSLVRGLHFMMLGHDLSKSPGQYRNKSIYVHDEGTDQVVYEGPDGDEVPRLMKELAASLMSPIFSQGRGSSHPSSAASKNGSDETSTPTTMSSQMSAAVHGNPNETPTAGSDST